MNDAEIAEALALKMGWEKKEREVSRPYILVGGGLPPPPAIDTYWETPEGKIIKDWSPATSWADCGIVIKWMEGQGKQLEIQIHESLGRLLWFDKKPVIGIEEQELIPRHICLAALMALEGLNG